MRRIAKQLDVAPGALYWHFPNKQELLGAIAYTLVSEISYSTKDLDTVCVELFASLTSLPSGAEITLAASATRTLPVDPTHMIPPALWHYVLGAAMDFQERQEAAKKLGFPEPRPINVAPVVRALLDAD